MKALALPVGIAVVALFLWSSPLLFPLKIFVVFLHELSHGLAAIMTGGSIERIELSANQGGVCYTRGGIRFFVLSAGYLGSMVGGAILLVASARSRRDRELLGLVGFVTLTVTLVWVRTLFGFGFGVLTAAAMLGVAWKLPPRVSDVLLQTLGTVSCLYAVWDIGSDLIARTVPGSDAHQLGQITGIPSVVWGVVWAGAALVVAVIALRLAAGGQGEGVSDGSDHSSSDSSTTTI